MESMLEVKDLVKKYGDFTAVKGITFDIKEGEIFSLLGPYEPTRDLKNRKSFQLSPRNASLPGKPSDCRVTNILQKMSIEKPLPVRDWK
jgi:ABC-type phosphonate transport system ATPase subunit